MKHSPMTSTMTSKGQITIPNEVRVKLQLTPGTQFFFEPQKDGAVLMRPKNGDVTKLTALLKPYVLRSHSVEEMTEGVQEAVAADVMRSLRR